MGDGFYFLDILIFAMVAVFLVYRLRSVLGRRTGEERQRPNPFAARTGQPANPTTETTEPAATPGRVVDAAPPSGTPADPLQEGIARIRGADPSFDRAHFLSGARQAFHMIVAAFAQGDTATLRPLLADDVYDHFAEEIRHRNAAGETLESTINGVDAVELIEARLDGRTAFVTVKFVTRQTNVVRSAAGEVVDGEPGHPVDVTDLWTFSRNTRAKDPNWVLVETRTPN
jgi:predicted lipid-binding transport protein (Tim44 family)